MEEFSARQGTIAVLARQAAASDGAGGMAADSPLSAWQEMEDRIDNIDLVFEAQREVDEALAERRGPSGMTRAEVEAKFVVLESRGASEPPPPSGGGELDEELARLKKRYRV